MRFFPRKDSTVSKTSGEHTTKEEPKAGSDVQPAEVDKSQSKLEEIQKKCKGGRTELQDITQRAQKVREEYDASIETLMSVKKDLNQGRMELDAVNREYKNVSDRLNAYETSAEVDMHLAKSRDSLLRARDETKIVMQQRDELKGKAEQQQAALSKLQDEIKQAEQQRDELKAQTEQQQVTLSMAKDEMAHAAEHGGTGALSKLQDEINQAEQQRDELKGKAEQQQAALSKLQDEIRQAEKERENQSNTQGKIMQAAEHGDANTRATLSKLQDEIKQAEQRRDELKGQAEKERKGLSETRKERIMAKERLDEINAMLYNAKGELGKKAKTQETGILTTKEKTFIQGGGAGNGGSARIIEAASAVVGSLKSKLKEVQDKIDSVQVLLEEEREKHKKTMRELESFRKNATKSAKPKGGKDAA